jgi:hypothetical protein
MREVDGMLQITCYSKSTNFKSVIVLDSKTYLPKAIYQSPIAPTYNVSQTFNNIMKDTDSETIYNLIKNEATVIYKMDNNKITIAEIDADLLMDNYRIRRTNKKGDLIFSKDLINIVSKVNLIKNDKVHQ